MKVENGKVIERRIIKEVLDDFRIDFGKCQVRSLMEVIEGKINTALNLEFLCKEYIQEVISCLSSNDYDKYANYDPGEDDYERDYFNAMTDGQLGDYDDFDGNIDDIDTWARG